jgi:hypothetical protein
MLPVLFQAHELRYIEKIKERKETKKRHYNAEKGHEERNRHDPSEVSTFVDKQRVQALCCPPTP